jgi:hypothetical protein
MKRLTLYIYNVLGITCFVVWTITTTLQVINPHPYRGLVGNLVLVIGLVLFYIHARINHLKSPLYDPDKKKHFRNWVIQVFAIAFTAIIVGFLYLKFF